MADASSLLALAGDVGTGVVNGISNWIGAKRQYKYNKKLLEDQQAINLENWNRVNEYNSPSAQVQRLVDAGINPAAVFGNNSSTPAQGMPSPSEGFSMPNMGLFGSFGSAVQNYLGFEKIKAEIDLLKKQAGKAESESQKAESDTRLNDAKTKYQEVINKWADLSESERINQLKASIKSAESNSALSEVEARKIEEELPFIARLNEAQITKLQADAQNAFQQSITEFSKRRNLDSSSANLIAQATLCKLQGDNVQADTLLKQLQYTTDQKEQEKLLIEMEGLLQENWKKEFENWQRYGGFNPSTSSGNNLLYLLMRFSSNVKQEIKGSGETSALDRIESQLGDSVSQFLARSYSGARSHHTHRNPHFRSMV